MFNVSVIICTYNPRKDYLQRVLDALREQSLPKDQWELLVIDNASNPPVQDNFDLAWCANGRMLREGNPGKLNAWLLGVEQARGSILVFVDDDNVLSPTYLEQALAISAEWPFIGAWGGSLRPEFETPLPSWCGTHAWMLSIEEIREDVWSNFRDDFRSTPAGAGLCVRKQVAEYYRNRCLNNRKVMSLDRHGEGHGGYGDTDQAHCALDLGLGTGKSSRLWLTHLIPSSRLTLSYFLKRSEDDAASLQLFRAVRGLPVQKPLDVTPLRSVRWFFHRLIHRIPRQQYEIAKAHQRGLAKGWLLAQAYLKESSTGQNTVK